MFKPRTYFFKKVCAAAFNFAHAFLILIKVFWQQKLVLVFYDIIMPNTPLLLLLFSLWIESKSRNCSGFCAILNTKITYTLFLTSIAFFNSALVFLHFSSVKRQKLLRCYLRDINIFISRNFLYLVYVCIYSKDSMSVILIY